MQSIQIDITKIIEEARAEKEARIKREKRLEEIEAEIRATAKLYEWRDTMRRFHGDNWQSHIDAISPIIRKVAEESNTSILDAAIHIAENAIKDEKPNESLMVLAVACEILDDLYQSQPTKNL